jgi:hypothetical protein
MTDPMYLLDFRRMTVEKIDDPKPPSPADESLCVAGITFAALGTPPSRMDEDDEHVTGLSRGLVSKLARRRKAKAVR